MDIREASAADAAAVAEVHVAAIRAAYRADFPPAALAAIGLAARAERWRQNLADDSAVTLIGDSAGGPAGFVHFGPCRDGDLPPERVGEVMALYVRPVAWGTGVGRALLREALKRLGGLGYEEVVLWVLATNRRAIGFYERFGFVRDGARKRREMYGVPATLVRLRRDLTEGA